MASFAVTAVGAAWLTLGYAWVGVAGGTTYVISTEVENTDPISDALRIDEVVLGGDVAKGDRP